MRVCWLLIAACSTPAPKQDPVYTPPDDEQKSFAWQASRPDAGLSGWMFDWQFYRENYEKLMKTPIGSTKCDWRAKPRKGVECLPPDRPRQHAAKVRRVDPDDAHGTIVQLDIGHSDKLTKDWWGALIDDKGRRVSEWVRPHHVALHISSLRISMNTVDARKFTRVALVKNKPDDASEQHGLFSVDWEGFRKAYDADPQSDMDVHAAKVKRVSKRTETASELEIDIGSRDKLTMAWWGAVVDERGYPISEWAHPTDIRDQDARIVFELPVAAARQQSRVVLLKELPESLQPESKRAPQKTEE